MQRLGLNPTDQEVVDIPNKIARDGLIYFPGFCHLVLKSFRQDGETELFRQNMFKVRHYLSLFSLVHSDAVWH